MTSKSRITLVLLVAAITLGGAPAATAGPFDAAAQTGDVSTTDTPMDDGMSTDTPMDDGMDDDMSTDTPMDDDMSDDDMSTDTPMDDEMDDEMTDEMDDSMDDDDGGLPVVPLAIAGIALVGIGLAVAYRR